MTTTTIPAGALRRFKSKALRITADGCWLWPGPYDENGYGRVWFKKRKYLAHRVAWMLYKVGDIADLCVCHHCDNPPCVRPAHLFVGSHGDNASDRHIKGRSQGTPGEKHNSAKLTAGKVLEIRERYDDGERPVDLAPLFSVTPTTIVMVGKRRTWRHI